MQKVYVAPRNSIEETLVDIWQEILGIDQIGIHDNFFELGGHSLLAVSVISKLKKINIHIPVSQIFRNNTINDLANYLHLESDKSVEERLIPFSKKGENQTVILIPGAIGVPYYLNDTATALSKLGHPVWGYQYNGIEPGTSPDSSIKNIALDIFHHIERNNLLSKELIITGHSLGGMIGFELVHLLESKSISSSQLVVMDGSAPTGKSNGATNDPKELLLELISLGSDAENKSFRVEDFSELSFEDLQKEALNLFIDWGIFAKSSSTEHMQSILNVYMNSVLTSYNPNYKTSASTSLILANNKEDSHLHPDPMGLQWKEFCTNLNIINSPGNHISMVKRENAKELADAITGILCSQEAESIRH